MLNLLDQLFGLTAKVLEFIFNWPFLLFVFLVWIVNRYRDQIGSTIDRRGTIRRGEISSAIREELDPLTKDIGDLKPDVYTLRTQVARIEARQSDYTSESLLGPITARVQALEQALEKMHTSVDRLAGMDFQEQLSNGISPITEELEGFRRDVELLTTRLDRVGTDMDEFKQEMAALRNGFEPVKKDVDSVTEALKGLQSQTEAQESTESFQQLQGDMQQFRKELTGLTDALTTLKDDVAAQAEISATASAATGARDAELIPLRVMKDALASTRWEWRRVKKLASIAGLSEDKAMKMLENDPDLTVKKDDWGRRIAKLSKK